jgi:thiol-disulfide isomerase/thioredoxin
MYMKNLFLKFCLLVSVPLFCVTCTDSAKLTGNEFLIEGILSDVEDGVVISLIRWDGDSGSSIGTDTLMHGRFSFRGETEFNSERLTVSPRGDGFASMSLGVWVAPRTKVKIEGKGKLHPVWEVKSNVPNQKEENRYTNKSRDLLAEMASVSAKRNELIQKIMAATSREESLPYRQMDDSIRAVTNSLSVKMTFADIEIMEKTNISPVWLKKMKSISLTLKLADADAEYIDELRAKTVYLFGKMSEEDKVTPLGYEITANIYPPSVVEVGDTMADTDLLDINGNTKHLSAYLGKFLLLDFWSRGCGPCIMALPEMKEISETYTDILTIISISLDGDVAWKEAMNKHDMPWVNIRDPKGMGGLAANYGVRGIPNYVMISPEGQIVDKWMGFGEGYLKRKVSENIK